MLELLATLAVVPHIGDFGPRVHIAHLFHTPQVGQQRWV